MILVEETALPGVKVITPAVRRDERGSFSEMWHLERYAAEGLPSRWLQDNVSRSVRGVLRGLHLQHPRPQGKLVSVLHGAILDVAVDVRVGSATFGRSVSVELSEGNGRQMWVPEGFAHGFLVTSERATVHYKCTECYSPADECTLLWNDPELGIEWGVREPILSAKDAAGLRLGELAERGLPSFHPSA